MRAQIANLGELLNIERKQSTDLSAELDRITSQLLSTEADRDSLTAQLADDRPARKPVSRPCIHKRGASGQGRRNHPPDCGKCRHRFRPQGGAHADRLTALTEAQGALNEATRALAARMKPPPRARK